MPESFLTTNVFNSAITELHLSNRMLDLIIRHIRFNVSNLERFACMQRCYQLVSAPSLRLSRGVHPLRGAGFA